MYVHVRTSLPPTTIEANSVGKGSSLPILLGIRPRIGAMYIHYYANATYLGSLTLSISSIIFSAGRI